MLRDALTRTGAVATWPCDEINAIWRHYWAAWPNDELCSEHATPRVRRFVRREFQRVAHRTRAQWVIEKTCANSLRVDFVQKIVPEAKFIFIVRDGRDVVASAVKRWCAGFDFRYTLKKLRYVPLGDIALYGRRFLANRVRRALARDKRLKSWGPRFEGIDAMLDKRSLPEVCAEQWSRCVVQASQSLACLPASRMCFVRYETFVCRPAIELARVAEFLGIRLKPENAAQIAATCTADSVGKWRRELDATMVQMIEPQIERTAIAFRAWEATAHQTCRSAA
jgi:hypothetical protein